MVYITRVMQVVHVCDDLADKTWLAAGACWRGCQRQTPHAVRHNVLSTGISLPRGSIMFKIVGKNIYMSFMGADEVFTVICMIKITGCHKLSLTTVKQIPCLDEPSHGI
ncbi:MAG: hypothetical protein U5L72_02205 [Bacteroidales bacterium]|nr:hypothetical protein [Bacteroidales bacterium]